MGATALRPLDGRAALGPVLAGGAAAVGAVALLLESAPLALAGLGLAAALAPLAVRAWQRPAALVPVLVAFVYLNLSQVLDRRLAVPPLLPALFVALVALTLLRGAVDGDRLRRTPGLLLLLPYPAVVVLSTTWARDTALADAGAIEILKCLAIATVVAVTTEGLRGVHAAIAALAASASFLAVLALGQAATGAWHEDVLGLARIKQAQIYGDVFEPRAAGPVGDPNFFAQALVMVVPITLALAFAEPRLPRRALAFGAAALAAAGTVLTYSRGAALALGLVTALSAVSLRVDPRRAAAALGFALVVFLAAPESFTRRLVTIEQIVPGGGGEADRPDSSFEERRLLTGTAWTMFRAAPGAGVGVANYAAHFDAFAPEVGSVQRELDDRPHYPHSLYLEIAAETGLLGLAAFGALVAGTLLELHGAARRLRHTRRAIEAALARGLQIAIAGYLFTSLFLHGEFVRYLWLLFGLSIALGRVAREQEATT